MENRKPMNSIFTALAAALAITRSREPDSDHRDRIGQLESEIKLIGQRRHSLVVDIIRFAADAARLD